MAYKETDDKFVEFFISFSIVVIVIFLGLELYKWSKNTSERIKTYKERKEYTQQLWSEVNQNCEFSAIEKSKGFVPLDRICKDLPEIVSLFSKATGSPEDNSKYVFKGLGVEVKPVDGKKIVKVETLYDENAYSYTDEAKELIYRALYQKFVDNPNIIVERSL